MNVSVAIAKGNLAKLIRLAESGETITIKRHGKPVAQLIQLPPELRSAADVSPDAWLNKLLLPSPLKWP